VTIYCFSVIIHWFTFREYLDVDGSRVADKKTNLLICGDDGVSSSEAWYGSAKANRPPRVYISPRDFATLAPPRTFPTPGNGGSHPAADSPLKHSRPIKPRYPSRCSLLFPEATRPPTISWVLWELESHRKVTTTRPSTGISGYGCIPQVLAPENFRARSRSLIDYLFWRRKSADGACQMDPIVRRGNDRFFFARGTMHAERKKYLYLLLAEKKNRDVWNANDATHNLSLLSRCELWHYFKIFYYF